MLKTTYVAYQTVSKRAYLNVALVLILIASIGFSTVHHYGMSVDEGTEIAMVRRNIEFITKGTPIPGDLKYFGPVFNVTSEIVFQAQQFLTKGFGYNPLNYKAEANDDQAKVKALGDRVRVKHYMTFLVSLITYAAVAGLVGILCGANYAWFGAAIFAFMPLHWGHSFFNPKDPPFAALFTLATLVGAYLINYYVNEKNSIKLGLNRATLFAILYGTLLGVVTGIRVGGFLILAFILITYLALKIGEGTRKDWINVGILYAVLCLTWFAVNTLCYPFSWSNPIGGFLETIEYLSGHKLKIDVLFEGRLIPIQQLPWNYLPTWMFFSIPLIFQLGFWVGLGFIASKYSKFSNLQKACALLLIFQVLFIPLVAIVKHSPMYDGMRHFLFTLPAIATITACVFIWIYQRLTHINLKLAAVMCVATIFSAIAFDMIALHPYEYIYVNRAAGGLARTLNQYDQEYWGLSLREGIEWINQNAPANSTVRVNGFMYSAQLFADPKLNLVDYEQTENQDLPKPYYYLAWPRWDAPKKLPECPVVYQVKRVGVPLSVIKRCD